MYLFDQTFAAPADNLACDEALLAMCERGFGGGILRFWEPSTHFVVLGYGSVAGDEVDLDACRRLGVSIFRRSSGGGSVLQGPGCMNYSLVLHTEESGPFATITATTAHIMARNAAALQPLVSGVITVRGTSDLTIDDVKFSGNAQRRLNRALLFHGTILVDFDLSLIETVLRLPARQPAYRAHRPHRAFLRNVAIPRPAVREALRNAWTALQDLPLVPLEEIRRLAHERYTLDSWTYRR